MKKSTQFLLLIAVISVCFIHSSNSTPLFFDFFKNLFGGGNGNNNRPSYRPNQQQPWANGGQYTKQKKYPWDIFGMFGFKNVIRPNPGRPAYNNNNNNRPMNNYNRPNNRPNYRPPTNNYGGNQAGQPIVNNNYRPNGGGSRPSQWGTQNGNWATGNSGPSSGYAPPNNNNGYNPPAASRPSYGRPNNNVGPLGITQRPPTIITARIPTNGIVGPRPIVNNIGGSGTQNSGQQQWSQQYFPARINGKPITYNNGNNQGKPSYNGNQIATYFPTPPTPITTAAPQIDQQVSLFWIYLGIGSGFKLALDPNVLNAMYTLLKNMLEVYA